MVNTVSYATGMKISLSKHDLNLIKLNINRVLPEYGFDPIGKTQAAPRDVPRKGTARPFITSNIFTPFLVSKY